MVQPHIRFCCFYICSLSCVVCLPTELGILRPVPGCSSPRQVCRQTLLAAAAMPEPQHPYMCPTLQPDPAPDHPVLHLNVCHAPRPLICQAWTSGPFWSHLTCQGSLSADYGGNVAARLGQVPLLSYICCHWHCSAHDIVPCSFMISLDFSY